MVTGIKTWWARWANATGPKLMRALE